MIHEQDPGRLTALLEMARNGDPNAEADVVQLAYEELRRLAHHVVGPARDGVLQPTSLIHEAWIKLHGKLDNVNDREHFFALAVRAMRQILIDEARAQGRAKRGGGRARVSLSGDTPEEQKTLLDVDTLAEALMRLRDGFPRQAEAFEFRVLGALNYQQIGTLHQTSESTARSDVKFARAWLIAEIGGHEA